uniref:ELM2 domain-containing protein n=1 Tax=Parastrongyloides trichosuri TaxID=131310 RepID=A0A0N4ZGB2_PARTI
MDNKSRKVNTFTNQQGSSLEDQTYQSNLRETIEDSSDDEIQWVANIDPLEGIRFSGEWSSQNEKKYKTYLEEKKDVMRKWFSKDLGLTPIQLEKVLAYFESYHKYLIIKFDMQEKSCEEIKQKSINMILHVYLFIKNKDEGKILLKRDILTGNIHPEKLASYEYNYFMPENKNFAKDEILYSKKLEQEPAYIVYPCKKCSTVHRHHETCQNRD